MLEREVAIDADGIKLAGTLCLPAEHGRSPVVLMIHGSGPQDRDENIKGQRLDVFNTLAHHLAGEGIASLRYDKRGCGKSGGDFTTAGHFDHTADAGRWLEYLTASDFVAPDAIYALGHSEGTIIAAQLCLKYSSLAGIILLAPFLEHMEAILMRQAEHLASAGRDLKGFNGWLTRMAFGANPVKSQRKLIDDIKASNAPTLRSGLGTTNAKWLRELMQLDPSGIFRQVTCPALLISGGKDVQCDPADAARIADLMQDEAEAHVLPDLTHILRFDPESRPPSIFHYPELLKKPVEPAVLELVSAWLKKRIPAGDHTRGC